MPSPPSETNAAPRIVELRIDPEAPGAGATLRAVVEVEDPDGDDVAARYAWAVDGETVGGDSAKLVLRPDVRRDSVVRLEVVASDGRAESAAATHEVSVSNSVPVIAGLGIEPSGPLTAGMEVAVHPEASDVDGDPLEFEYAWRVNDALRFDATGPTFRTHGLASGDRIDVEVRASDGIDHSPSVSAPTVTVENLPPRVVSRPGSVGPGSRFDYQIVVEDPDAVSPPVFELAVGPAGMQVDRESGRVTWNPEEGDPGGPHPVRVIVDDGQGGRIAHTFEVGLRRPPPADGAP